MDQPHRGLSTVDDRDTAEHRLALPGADVRNAMTQNPGIAFTPHPSCWIASCLTNARPGVYRDSHSSEKLENIRGKHSPCARFVTELPRSPAGLPGVARHISRRVFLCR